MKTKVVKEHWTGVQDGSKHSTEVITSPGKLVQDASGMETDPVLGEHKSHRPICQAHFRRKLPSPIPGHRSRPAIMDTGSRVSSRAKQILVQRTNKSQDPGLQCWPTTWTSRSQFSMPSRTGSGSRVGSEGEEVGDGLLPENAGVRHGSQSRRHSRRMQGYLHQVGGHQQREPEGAKPPRAINGSRLGLFAATFRLEAIRIICSLCANNQYGQQPCQIMTVACVY